LILLEALRPVVFLAFSWYINPMTITQTVDIPADRRITLEVPVVSRQLLINSNITDVSKCIGQV